MDEIHARIITDTLVVWNGKEQETVAFSSDDDVLQSSRALAETKSYYPGVNVTTLNVFIDTKHTVSLVIDKNTNALTFITVVNPEHNDPIVYSVQPAGIDGRYPLLRIHRPGQDTVQVIVHADYLNVGALAYTGLDVVDFERGLISGNPKWFVHLHIGEQEAFQAIANIIGVIGKLVVGISPGSTTTSISDIWRVVNE